MLLLVIALVGCDHATKVAARSRLAPSSSVALLPGMVELRYVENEDTAFSLTQRVRSRLKAPLLMLGSLVGLSAIVALAKRRFPTAGSMERVAWALLFAGAFGNVIDRLRRGYVVDFIHVQHWPVFNVADIWIVAGALWLVGRAYAVRVRRFPSEPS
jgi:signal peptidase II